MNFANTAKDVEQTNGVTEITKRKGPEGQKPKAEKFAKLTRCIFMTK